MECDLDMFVSLKREEGSCIDFHKHNSYELVYYVSGSGTTRINEIQFAYKPEKPIADSPTEFSFSVQNLTTGQHIKNFKASVVLINDFQKAFKFLNIPVVNGDFFLKYSFPDSGHNQILVSINKDSFGLALASFRVSVSAPFPPPDILAKSIIVGVVIPAAIMTAILVLVKKKRGKLFIK